MGGFLKNAAVAIAALLVIFLLTEIFLRLFFPQNLNITQLDSEKIFEHKPGISTVLQRLEFKTHVRISSQGLRDREYAVQKPEGVKRIAVLGDSFVFGFGVEENEAFAKVLERLLNGNNSRGKYEVMNFGISAYGTEQEYLLLRDTVAAFHPDMVVLSFFPNDLKENVKYNLFEVQNSTLIQTPKKDVGFSLKVRNMVSWHSHLYSLFYFSVIDNKKISNLLIGMHLLNPSTKDPKADFNTLIYSNEQSKEYEQAFQKTLLLLDAMKKYLDERNIHFMVLVSPAKEQVDEGMMQKFASENGLNDINRTRVQDELVPWLKKEGIAAINPLDEFRQKNINNTFYFIVDGHWNVEGHTLVAEILRDNILKSNMPSKNK